MNSNYEFVPLTLSECRYLPQILKRRLPKAAQLYNLVQIKLSGLPSEAHEYIFYRCDGTGLNEDVTCFVSKLITKTKNYYFILAPLCTDEETTKIINAFNQIINWDENTQFFAIDDVILKPLYDCCVRPNGWTAYGPGEVYYIPMDFLKAMDTSLPSGVTVRQLKRSEMDTVFKYWKWSHENDLEAALESALRLRSAGLFVDGAMISWGIEMWDGGIHAVYTLDEYRGRGYGKMLMKCLCKDIGEELGHFPIVHIEAGNNISVAMMKNVGFQVSHVINWIDYSPKSSST